MTLVKYVAHNVNRILLCRCLEHFRFIFTKVDKLIASVCFWFVFNFESVFRYFSFILRIVEYFFMKFCINILVIALIITKIMWHVAFAFQVHIKIFCGPFWVYIRETQNILMMFCTERLDISDHRVTKKIVSPSFWDMLE